jgi:aryl-alcohol dehydrogenase-like predicted oxidoreductase
MRYLEVGGARVSVIGLGTWQFGSTEWGYGDAYARGTAAGLVRRALDLGINLVDTAEIYAFGRSERIVGEALAGRREDAFLATKLFPMLPIAPVVGWRARASARRLRTDHLDLYQLHWPSPQVPLGNTMAGMRRVQAAGLVRHVGVSNYDLQRWKDAEAALGSPVLSNQVRFSLVNRGPQHDLLPHAQRQGRIVIAYSPLAQGLFSGRYDASHRPVGGVRRFNPLFAADRVERVKRLVAELTEVGRPSGATSSQVALAWLVRKPNVVAIPGASSASQVEQNAAAADLELSQEDDARLEAAADAFYEAG